jgi:hypothetical protein
VAPREGWLFVGDRWARSWQAQVNGAPVELDGANLVFRALRVPAGPLHVEMRYRPRFLFLVWPSWLALLLALGVTLWRRGGAAS